MVSTVTCLKYTPVYHCSKALLLTISQHIPFVTPSHTECVCFLLTGANCFRNVPVKMIKLRTLQMEVYMCRGKRHVCGTKTHIHSGLQLAPWAE